MKPALQRISLRPYIGTLYVAKTRKQFADAYKRLIGDEDCGLDEAQGGRYVRGPHRRTNMLTYIVYADDGPHMVHELSHVVLDLFENVGVEPFASSGEPFCYMLGQLCRDTGIKR